MTDFKVDTVIIGAGVVGLAIANELSYQNKDVLVIESQDDFGQITSSRNSGVIHAGIYYPEKSLKAKFCLLGNRLLYEYCKQNSIPHKNTKKILVATSEDQINNINNIKEQAEKNGVEGVTKITKDEVSKLEPYINCEEALLVPSSGIIDAISLMRSLVGKIENSGNMISYRSNLLEINYDGKNFRLLIDNNGHTQIECKELINSAGLYASNIANKIEGLDKKFVPKTYFAKGNYFSANKDLGIRHLIYPIPDGFSLGIHLTLELDYSVKFGPDVEWVEEPDDYNININRKKMFVSEIKKYLPNFDSSSLTPSYSGIRPIIEKKDKAMRDFVIQTQKIHTIHNLINLYGIESPGLTSSLAIAKEIKDNLQ